jgi:hypothetical protein
MKEWQHNNFVFKSRVGVVTMYTTSFNIKQFIIDSTECIEGFFGCEVNCIVDVASLAEE